MSDELALVSAWIDKGLTARDSETKALHRIVKVGEENGEVIAALIGVTGTNPRKGVTGTWGDVVEELLDVAVTALGAVEHLTGNVGASMDLLTAKIHKVAVRAGCWLWTGALNADGYGTFKTEGGTQLAHRWSYAHMVADISSGQQLDHVCHTTDPTCVGGTACLHRRCVNPYHLEIVDGAENTRRIYARTSAPADLDRCPSCNGPISPVTGECRCSD